MARLNVTDSRQRDKSAVVGTQRYEHHHKHHMKHIGGPSCHVNNTRVTQAKIYLCCRLNGYEWLIPWHFIRKKGGRMLTTKVVQHSIITIWAHEDLWGRAALKSLVLCCLFPACVSEETGLFAVIANKQPFHLEEPDWPNRPQCPLFG